MTGFHRFHYCVAQEHPAVTAVVVPWADPTGETGNEQ
jgi:hypothetical protein